MAIERCLDGMVNEGKLDRDRAEAILKDVRKKEAGYAKWMNQSAAERKAAQKVAERLSADALRKKQLVARQVLATHRLLDETETHPHGFVAGVVSHLTKDPTSHSPWSNVEYRHKGILQQFGRMMDDFFAKYEPKRLGLKEDHAGLSAVIRELYGEDGGDAVAKAAAAAFRDTGEYGRARFNAAGGDIRTRSDWHAPQSHDRWRVRDVGKDEWVSFVAGLKIEIRDPETGAMLNSRDTLTALHAIRETIASGGQIEVKAGYRPGGKLANRRADPRLIQFKDADSWLAYNDRFGEGSIYRLISGHLDGLARDIALLEVLGPNPDAMARYLFEVAKTRTANAPPAEDRRMRNLFAGPKSILAIYDDVARKGDIPDTWLKAQFIKGMGEFRAFLGMAQLGGATLTSITDLGTVQATAAWNGLSGTKAMARLVGQLNPASAADRAFARRLGLIAEMTIKSAGAAQRFQGEAGDAFFSRAAEGFHRLTGLTPLTRANRTAFGLEYMATLADHAGMDLAAVAKANPALHAALTARGITAELWDSARRAPLLTHDGVKFMAPTDRPPRPTGRRPTPAGACTS